MARTRARKRLKRRLPKPVPFDLAKALGEIAIEWNYLEVKYHQLIHCYLNEVSADIAAAILNAMSAVSKADFFEFLIAKRETHKGLLDHLDHFRKMMHIVTENRNILQHSLPSVEARFDYEGAIYKRNRLGKPVLYKATVDDFFQIIDDLRATHGYAYELIALCSPEGKVRPPKFFDEWTAAIEKPDMPHKLIPVVLGPTPKN